MHIVRQEPPWREPRYPRPWCGVKGLRTTETVQFMLMPEPVTRPTMVDGGDLPDPLPYHWPQGDGTDPLCSHCRTAEAHYRLGCRTKPILTALHFAENVKDGPARVERELAAMLVLIRAHPEEFREVLDAETVLAVLADRR